MVLSQVRSSDAVINGNPLMRAEVAHFVENNDKVSLYQKYSEYMFWGATTIMAGLVAVTLGLAGAEITLATLGAPLVVASCVTSLATFAGSVFFSRKAAEIESHNAVLQSDIDSQNQAHRMVQAFARAQAPDMQPDAAVPFTGAEKNWGERVGAAVASTADSWIQRVEAQRQVEEAAAIDALQH